MRNPDEITTTYSGISFSSMAFQKYHQAEAKPATGISSQSHGFQKLIYDHSHVCHYPSPIEWQFPESIPFSSISFRRYNEILTFIYLGGWGGGLSYVMPPIVISTKVYFLFSLFCTSLTRGLWWGIVDPTYVKESGKAKWQLSQSLQVNRIPDITGKEYVVWGQ